MPESDIEQAITYALARLEQELLPELSYHNFFHTQGDVLPAATELARLEGLGSAETQLVRVAAAWHDIGFLIDRQNHEESGAQLAAGILPGMGFDETAIQQIQGMIMATRLPQTPHNLLEQIIADADLDVLGRDDFLQRNQRLRDELVAFGAVISDEQWYQGQLRFLQNHSYFTRSAQQQRKEKKQKNIADIERLLSTLNNKKQE